MLTIKKQPYFKTKLGEIYLEDSLNILNQMPENSLDLIVTSPPFGLIKKKKYGNEDSAKYLEWFRPFAKEFYRVLKPSGSLVIDIGGSWNKGTPTRSLYHFKLVVMLCEEFHFFLAQDFYWWNPSKLPTPAEWVTIRRIRVKDSINTVWWLSKTEFPKASNTRVLLPYSDSMIDLLKNGYTAKERPSGHKISTKFGNDNGGAITSNLLAIANTESNDSYTTYCKENKLTIHPARFPSELPEFFIRMLTNKDDIVYDPFGGSCVTGEVCERLGRKWICSELIEDYLKGAVGGRFNIKNEKEPNKTIYSLHNPSAAWQPCIGEDISLDGGKNFKRKEK